MSRQNYFFKPIRFNKKMGDITPLLANKDVFSKAIDEMIKASFYFRSRTIAGLYLKFEHDNTGLVD